MTATITPKVEQTAPAVTTAASKGWRRFVPRIFGTILWLVAIICALAAIGRAFRSGMQPIRQTLDVLLVPAPANLAYAVFLAMLATATLSRKRVAWWFLTVYFILSAVVGAFLASILTFVSDAELVDDAGNDLFDTTDTVLLWVSIGISILALLALFLAKREFYAKVRKGSFRRALVVLVVLVAIGIGLGYSLVSAFPGTLESSADRLALHRRARPGRCDLLRPDPHRAGPGLGQLHPRPVRRDRPVRGARHPAAGPQQVLDACRPTTSSGSARLLAKFGDRDSLGYFATRRDKAVDLLADRQGRRHLPGGQRGQPRQRRPGRRPGGLGAGHRRLAATQARELRLDARRRWAPARTGAIAYARAGLKVIHLGDEAILLTKEFTLDGRDMRPVRQAVNRVERTGVHRAGPPARRHPRRGDARASRRWPTAWRDTETERGFSMALGRLGDPADGRLRAGRGHRRARRAPRRCSRSARGARAASRST